MKYVLDSSVAFKWVIPEIDTDKALRLRDDGRSGTHEFLAPEVFHIEVAHALTKAERQGRIAPPKGWAAWLAVMADAPRLVPSLPSMPRAFEVSSQFRTAVSDYLYVALAEQEKCDFVTADDRVVKNLKAHFPFIVPLSSLP
jgi:predicted nucleic acid-binding protein